MLAIKAACVLAAAVVTGGSTPPPCTCPPPEVETVSCAAGVTSFPAAVCTQTQQTPTRVLAVLACPPGETAISAGFRHVSGPFRPLLEMSPVVPSGAHPVSYRFIWRNGAGTVLRVYITCEQL